MDTFGDSRDYFIDVHGNERQYAFPAFESITDVHIESGNYSVSVIPPYYVMVNTMITGFSKDCSGVIHSNETKFCTVTIN